MNSKTNIQLLFLLLLFPILLMACEKGKEIPKLLEDIRRVDGPYVFYEGSKTKIVNVNPANEITKVDFSGGELEVVVPNQVPEKFSIKLMDNIQAPASEYENSNKIFVTSDIEGNYFSFVNLLIGNGVTDENLNWTFGNGDLVLVGDFVDRGEYVTQVLWLVYKLEKEAKEKGGKVHMIMGNHEAMLLEGDWRYTKVKYRELASKLDIHITELYGERTELGRWLRSKNMIERIGDVLFVHGGVSNTLLDKNLSLDEINDIGRDNYGADLENNTANNANLLFGRYGTLWFRGLVKSYDDYYDKVSSGDVDRLLNQYQSTNVVVGHNVVEDISTDFNGKVVRVDVEHPGAGGDVNESRALLIENGIFYKVTDAGTKIKL